MHEVKSNAEIQKNGQPEKKVKLSNDKEKNAIVTKEIPKSKGKQIDEVNAKKEIKTTTVKDMLRAQRDNLRNTVDTANGNKSSAQTAATITTTTTTTDDSSSSSDSSTSSDEDDHDDKDNRNDLDGIVVVSAPSNEKITEKPVVGANGANGAPNLAATSSETNGESVAEPVQIKLPENISENLRQKIKQMEEFGRTTTKIFSDSQMTALFYE